MSITPKALAILALLVGRHGEAISKEELLSTVWSDTAVEESNLSQNVYTLRKLFSVDFPGQVCIENIPRFGYRFNLPVEAPPEHHPNVAPPERQGDGEPAQGADVLVHSAAVQLRRSTDQHTSSLLPPVHMQPEEEPAGARSRKGIWVALALCGVCAAVLLFWQWPLVTSFARGHPQYVWTRLTANSDEDRVTAACLSPEANLFAYADADGVVVRSVLETPSHLLPSPKMKAVEELSWFPDQLHLVLSGQGADTGKQQIWMISLLGEAPRLLREDARLGQVSHDGSAVAFVTPDASAVWVMGPAGERARQVARSDSGHFFSVLLWNAHDRGLILEQRPTVPQGALVDNKGNALAYSKDSAYWHIRLSDGRRTAEEPGFSMGYACLTHGNDLIYSISTPEEGRESTNLWRVRIDEDSGAILSRPVNLYDSADYAHLYQFSCSGDGGRILVVRKQGATGVYVGDVDASDHRLTAVNKLSMGSNLARPSAWWSDSNSVYYGAADVAEDWKIYSQSLARHDPDLVVAMSGTYSMPIFTPDHRWMLFRHEDVLYGSSTLYRMSMEDRSPAPVPAQGDILDFRCPLASGACVVQTHDSSVDTAFSLLDPESGKGKSLATLHVGAKAIIDWDISPDGKELVIAMDSTRPLHILSLKNANDITLPFHPPSSLSTVRWSAKGNGFFVATSSGGSLTDLSFVELDGKATLLRTTASDTWAVPSPDGKHIAFADRSLDSNVWLLSKKQGVPQ